MKQENILKEYSDNNILQATPEGLILLLYNKCIIHIETAKHYVVKRDIERTNTYIQKAQDIICYLRSSLDTRYPLSDQLSSMYEFILNKLMEANIKKDIEQMEIALDFAKQLRDLWIEATQKSISLKSKAV